MLNALTKIKGFIKTFDFSRSIHCVLKYRRLSFKMVLGACWTSLGLLLGPVGGLLGGLWKLLGVSWAPFGGSRSTKKG